MTTLSKEIYTSFKNMSGAPVALIGLILSVGTMIYDPKYVISVTWVVPSLVIITIIAIILIDLSYRMYCYGSKQLPKVLLVNKAPPVSSEAVAILLLEPSIIFAHESIVTVYYFEEGYERAIGIGYVFVVQDEGQIQILITHIFDDQDMDIIQKGMQSNKFVLDRLRVKPSIPKIVLSGGKYEF
jgi:hypothetical protein